MSSITITLAMALAASSLTAIPVDETADTVEVVHQALIAVDQEVSRHDLEVAEARSATAHVRTDKGTFSVTTDHRVDSAVIEHNDGVQVMAVLEEGETSTSYELTLPDGVELVPSGGGYEFSVVEDGVRLDIGSIEAPWAVDANGQQIATSYELVGEELVQHIHGEAAYPVVADPRLTFGVGVYLNVWGWEINAFNTAIVAAGGAAAIATCALEKVPVALRTLARIACTAVGAPTLAVVYRQIQNIHRNGARAGTCYQMRMFPMTTSFYATNTKNCSG